MVLNKVYMEDVKTVQIEQWSSLSDMVKYVQHDQNLKDLHKLDIKAIEYKNHRRLYEKLTREENRH